CLPRCARRGPRRQRCVELNAGRAAGRAGWRRGLPMIEMGARPLTLDDVAAVARDGTPVVLAAPARTRMAASRAVIQKALAGEKAIYGVNTGFGTLKDRTISADQVRDLQMNLLRSHAAGVGRFAPPEVSRAML